MIALFIVLAIVLILAVFICAEYNKFVRLRNRIEESFSQLDATLKKRFDLIPNLVETVKGYASHEKETLENVINARNRGMSATTLEEVDSASKSMTNALGRLFALSESYPDLKANTNFTSLQNTLNKMEDEILASRKYYNAVVKQYNTAVEVFPSNIVAKMFGYKRKGYLEIDEKERENVKVSFN